MPKKEILKPYTSHSFKAPIAPFAPEAGRTVAETLEALRGVSFQGRTLGTAFSVWKRALEDSATLYFGLAGAMTPAGLRKTLVTMIEKRFIDVLVTTGANMFHDAHQTAGGVYYKCSPAADDVELRKQRMDRIYDVVASDREMLQLDEYLADWAVRKFKGRAITTREYFYELGLELADQKGAGDSVLVAAAKAGVPIYCPAIGDSGFGIGLAGHNEESRRFVFDVIGDVYETGRIALESKTTGVIIVGGGTPKNFSQQTWVTAEYLTESKSIQGGHKYCIQLTQDAPHWGGLSGCTFEESTSWGKIDFEANKVASYVDAMIGLPLLVQGLVDLGMDEKRKARPVFKQGEKLSMIPAAARAKERVLA